jgi:hypothetical protein
MLVACRLAGLSALERHYASLNARAQCGVRSTVRASRAAAGATEATKASTPFQPLQPLRNLPYQKVQESSRDGDREC